MFQSCCTTSSAPPNIGGWSLRRSWMRNSRKPVWRLASDTKSRSLRLGLTQTMYIFSCKPCHSIARSGSCKSSKALPPEKSLPPVQKSRNSYGADNSGAPDTSSAQLGNTVTRRASRNTSRIKVANTSNCTGNNSTYSDTSQLAAG